MPPFKQNRHITFWALVALEPLVSLMSRLGPCRERISGDRHTDRHTHTHTHTQTYKPSTVTLAVHVRRGLIMSIHTQTVWLECNFPIGGREGGVTCFCWLSPLQLNSSLLSFALTYSPRIDSTRKAFEILCWAPPPVCPPSMYLM